MISPAEILSGKFSALLRREQMKRREQILVSACFFALGAAVLVWPIAALLPPTVGRGWLPLLFFLGLAPALFFKRRWRAQDSTRAVVEIDKSLGLQERAVTAWEILARKQPSAPENLVLRQAHERLEKIELKTLLARERNWQGALLVPLVLIWLALVWFDAGVPLNGNLRLALPHGLAYKLREFARELQEKAQSEGLSQTLQVGRELEKIAQKGIDAKASDERFQSEIAGMKQRLAGMEKPAADSGLASTSESEESLRDLRSELGAARDLLDFSEATKTPELSQTWLDQLAALPQLKRQLDKQGQAPSMGRNELKSFLDRLEKQVTGELDRRTVLDAQKFLQGLMKQGEGQKAESDVQVAGRGEREAGEAGLKAKSPSDLPGKEPGRKAEGSAPPPEFPGAATRLKGLLREGQSDGLVFKGKPSAGKSEVSQEEVVASYRRQAEAELNSERVPEALKETIRNYFLSLGMGEGRAKRSE